MQSGEFHWPLEYSPPGTCFTGIAEAVAIGGLVSGVVGTGVSIMGAQQTAAANQASANYQAQVARNNQQIAQQNADYARQAGQVEAQTESMKTAALIGQEVTGPAAGNIDPTTGSPLAVQTGSRNIRGLDVLNIMQQAEMKARGFNIQGSDFAATAGLESMKARNAGTAGLYSAGSSALSGVSSFADKWASYAQKGVPGFGGGSRSADYGSSNPTAVAGAFG